jgi:polyhydroxybutyrate depolymerase
VLARPSGQAKSPTIIMLHGFGGTGAETARRSGLDQLAPRNGFVAAFPDGLRNRWNFFPPGKELAGFIRDSAQVGGVPDDVGFLTLLTADLVRRGISDPKRIYLAGYSNGSFMTLRMMCADTGLFAAIGLLASGMPDLLAAECSPKKPTAALMINGTIDNVVPYGGGPVLPGAAFTAWPAERLVEFFRTLNGCAGSAEQSVYPSPARNRIEAARWTGCAGAPLSFYRMIDGDHTTPWQLNAGQALLDFFRDKVGDDATSAGGGARSR